MSNIMEKLTAMEIDAIKLAEAIISASLNWTGADEEKAPVLKLARTLAGIVLDDVRALGGYMPFEAKPEEPEVCENLMLTADGLHICGGGYRNR